MAYALHLAKLHLSRYSAHIIRSHTVRALPSVGVDTRYAVMSHGTVQLDTLARAATAWCDVQQGVLYSPQ